MNTFNSLAMRLVLLVFGTIAVLATTGHSSSLDERFKVVLNTTLQNVKQTENPVDKRKLLGNFLVKMDQGLGMAKSSVSEKDGKTISALQVKMEADYAALNGNGVAKIPDSELNHFANFVQQDMEQADGFYISAVGLIIVLLILLLILR